MGNRDILLIESSRVRLRLLEEADLSRTLAWRNREDIRKWFVHSEIISPAQHQQWFLNYLERADDYMLIIEEIKEFQKPVGQVSLYNIDLVSGKADYGRLIIGERNAQGKGIAKEATSLLLSYAFNTWKLRRIELEVFTNNKPAIAIYRGCGFSELSESNGLIRMVKVQKRCNSIAD
jgi:RimJ/RimL family protein N-acetyltransferase